MAKFRSWEKVTELDDLFQGAQTMVKMLQKRGYIVGEKELNFIPDDTYESYLEKKPVFEKYINDRKNKLRTYTTRDALRKKYKHPRAKGCVVVFVNNVTQSERAYFVKSEVLDAELQKNIQKR